MDDEKPKVSRNPGVEDLRAAERQGIRGDGGFEKPSQVESLTADIGRPSKSEKQAERNENGASSLGDAENSAVEKNVGGLYKGGGLKEVKDGETKPEGFYSGKGEEKQRFRGKSKNGKKKKVGPFAAIIIAIFGFGGVLFGAQMFQPFSLVANFMQAFNSMHISANARSGYWVRWQLGGVDAGVKNPVKGSIFGEAKFKITKSQSGNLLKQGIEYDESAKVLKYKGEDITADEFKAKYDSDSDFHEAYNAGSQTWRGQFANWFGSATIDFFTNNRLTRNMFKDFRQKVDESGESSMTVLKSILKQRVDGGGADGGTKIAKSKDSTEDSDGNPVTDANGNDTDADGNRLTTKVLDGENSEDVGRASFTSETGVTSKIKDIAGKFGAAANVACALSTFAGTVSALVAATQALQIINLTTGIFESVDKSKAGLGDESPINDFATALNTRTDNVNVVLSEDAGVKFGSAVDSGQETVDGATEEVATKKTAMESEGINSLYGDGIVNPKDPSVASFNLTSFLPKIFGGISLSMTAFTGCTIAKMATNAISAVGTIASAGACVAGVLGALISGGVSLTACFPELAKLVGGIIKSVAIGAAVMALASVLMPIITKALTRDLISKLSGEDFGNAITSGANMYQGSVHRGNGGSLATEEKYTAYAVEQKRIIADDARYERESLSPFDATSNNTFLGTLLRNVATMTTGSGSIMSTVTSANSMLTNSISAMAPAAVADGVSVKKTLISNYEDVCPYLASIGAVGDAYCNPYMITDTSTMSPTPGEVINKVNEISADNFEDGETPNEGNVIINDKSPLAKYIVYCDQRQSQFGITDWNIAQNVAKIGDTGSAAGNIVIGAIPVIGDALDVLNAKEQLDNSGYISGESCVAGNNVTAADSPNWSTAKYYQRFIEDQSLAESTGLIKESAVTAYLREYYEKNPIDNSYEGMLARYSGLTTEQVADVIDILWYAEYIQNYDPTERYAFEGAELVDDGEMTPVEFDNEYVLASDFTPRGAIIYADVRNRNYVV